MRGLRMLAGVGAALLVTLGLAAAPAAAEDITKSLGRVSASLTESGGDEPTTLLTVVRDGVSSAFPGLEGDEGVTWLPAEWDPLELVDLDVDGEAEVVVRLYSGGPHCCVRSVIAWWDPTAQGYRLDTRDWGNADWLRRDLNADGGSELIAWDDGWAYWQTDYATSARPLAIWQWHSASGQLEDATGAFPDQLLADMDKQWREFRSQVRYDYPGKGALAAYIADAYRYGAPGLAWRRLYRAYQRADRSAFVAALRRKLSSLGHRPAGDRPPPVPSLRRGRWRGCPSVVPDVGFISAVRARGVSCLVARSVAAGTMSTRQAPPRWGFVCRYREVAIEVLRVRCTRGPFENIRFYSGV